MKEQIYTIPINEAYETDCECPLCLLEKKSEQDAVEYALGAAMMEPDFRVESNDKGYCRKHFEMMFQKPNKLSLALVMETLVAENIKKLSAFEKKMSAKGKGGLFKKGPSAAEELIKQLDEMEKSCIVCDKINYTMERYITVLVEMWKTEPEFRSRFENSKGVCLPHMKQLLVAAEKRLGSKDAAEFASILYIKQMQELNRISDDVHRFTLKFDYRNKDMEWNGAEDAPKRSIEKTAGIMNLPE